jgi:hypothetical protein
MKPRAMRAVLRGVSTLEQLQELEARFTREWAGAHKGRVRVLKMMARRRRWLAQSVCAVQRTAGDRG